MVNATVICLMRTPDDVTGDAKASSGDPAPPPHSLRHKDCLSVYFHQAKLLWSSGTLTRRDRALLDELRIGLNLTVSEAARLESASARVTATPAEILEAEGHSLPAARPERPHPRWFPSWLQEKD
jgi:hypothetical protein